MGMPRKGSRKVEVDGEQFLWRIGHNTRHYGDAPMVVTLTIQRDEERPGRVCQVTLRSKRIKGDPRYYGHKASLNPQDVRDVISRALKRGWNPSERGSAFIPPGQIELTDYEQITE